MLISSPNFIMAHLSRSRQSNPCSILLNYRRENESFLSLLSPHDLSVVNLNLEWSVFNKDTDFRVLGHFNGIICLSDYEGNIALCNPATKESLLLPESCLLRHFPSNRNLIPENNAVGFGFDPKNNGYKVVRIVSYKEELMDGGFKSYPSRVEVYTSKAASWREIKNAMDRIKVTVWCTPNSSHTYFNGAFHWYGTDKTKNQEVILSFDMSEERFRTIPTPHFLSLRSKYKSLMVWNDNVLALVVYPTIGIDKMFEICVLNDYGTARECWSKVMIVGPIAGVEVPLLFWGNDEVLLESSDGGIMVYNRETRKWKKVSLRGEEETFMAVTCMSSLVSIKA